MGHLGSRNAPRPRASSSVSSVAAGSDSVGAGTLALLRTGTSRKLSSVGCIFAPSTCSHEAATKMEQVRATASAGSGTHQQHRRMFALRADLLRNGLAERPELHVVAQLVGLVIAHHLHRVRLAVLVGLPVQHTHVRPARETTASVRSRHTSMSAASSIGANPSGVWKSGNAFCTLTPPSETLPNRSPFTVREGYLQACMKRVM
jgi:hypothetical protein